MKAILTTLFYVPIYNLVAVSALYAPGGDIGIAIVLATIVVKVILLPLSLSAAHTQKKMKGVEGHLAQIKEDHKDDREQLARKTLELYKEHGIRPFMSIFSMLIQIPFIIALYFVVLHQSFPQIDQSLLYSFVHITNLHTSLLFLGIFDITQKSIFLALLAGVSQFVMSVYTIPVPPRKEKETKSDEFARAMSIQMRFILPLVIAFVAYTSGAIALYLITSAIFSIGQEFFVRRKHNATN